MPFTASSTSGAKPSGRPAGRSAGRWAGSWSPASSSRGPRSIPGTPRAGPSGSSSRFSPADRRSGDGPASRESNVLIEKRLQVSEAKGFSIEIKTPLSIRCRRRRSMVLRDHRGPVSHQAARRAGSSREGVHMAHPRNFFLVAAAALAPSSLAAGTLTVDLTGAVALATRFTPCQGFHEDGCFSRR